MVHGGKQAVSELILTCSWTRFGEFGETRPGGTKTGLNDRIHIETSFVPPHDAVADQRIEKHKETQSLERRGKMLVVGICHTATHGSCLRSISCIH